MPVTYSNPPGVRAPASRYSHAALMEGPGRRLVISGQVGFTPEGEVSASGEEQIRQCLRNLEVVLGAHGMCLGHVVKMTCFLTDTSLIPQWRHLREAAFGSHACTSTLLVISALADPRFVVEVEAEAFDG